jgi:2-phosphosulfolactate phosphatase
MIKTNKNWLKCFSIIVSIFSQQAQCDSVVKPVSIVFKEILGKNIVSTKSVRFLSPSLKKKFILRDFQKSKSLNITIVIDVFRAFTTAAYILEQEPKTYILTFKSNIINQLSLKTRNPFKVGKPEKGVHLKYHIPNSPTRVFEQSLKNRSVFHRSQAGGMGILLTKEADIILIAGFVNAKATASYVQEFEDAVVTIIPMGHEGIHPSLEDDLCGLYIMFLIWQYEMDVTPFLNDLKTGSGAYFFSQDQWQYPREDFQKCLYINRFNFPICAVLQEEYALLKRCDKFPERRKF